MHVNDEIHVLYDDDMHEVHDELQEVYDYAYEVYGLSHHVTRKYVEYTFTL